MAIEIDVQSNSRAAREDLEKIGQSVGRIRDSVARVSDSMRNFVVTLAGLGTAVATIKQLTNLSDVTKDMSSRLRALTRDQKDFNYALRSTKDIAMRTNTDLRGIVDLYGKLSLSSRNFNASQRQVARVTETITKGLAVSGASAMEARSAIIQMGQAFASGRFQGDELRSFTENAPVLAQKVADALEISVSRMRELGATGQLTAVKFFDALLDKSAEIDEAFQRIELTYAKSFENLGTALTTMFSAVLNYGKKGDIDTTSLPYRINSMAHAIYDAAKDIEQTFLNVRTEFWLFVMDISDGLRMLPSTITSSFTSLSDRVSKGASAVMDGVRGLLGFVDNIKPAEMSFSLDVNSIDVMKFIPKLDTAREWVKSWVVDVERAFFWLYDQVVGHSHIPDLQIETEHWLGKLLGKPLDYVKSFARRANEFFWNLYDRVSRWPFVKAVTEQLGEMYDRLKEITQGPLDSIRQFAERAKTYIGGLLKTVKDSSFVRELSSQLSAFSRRLEQSKLVVKLKEMVGIEGNVSEGLKKLTAADVAKQVEGIKVGAIVEKAAESKLLALYAGIASTIGFALMATFSSGSIVYGLVTAIGTALAVSIGSLFNNLVPLGAVIGFGILSVLSGNTAVKLIGAAVTAAFGLVAVKQSKEELSGGVQSIAKAIMDGFTWAVHKIIGGGEGESVFGRRNMVDTAMVLAKLALLFSAGRAMFMQLIKSIATMPMRVTDHITDRYEHRILSSQLNKENQKIQKLETLTKDNLRRSTEDLKKVTKEFSKVRMTNGRNISGELFERTQRSQLTRQVVTSNLSGVDLRRFEAMERASRMHREVQAATEARRRTLDSMRSGVGELRSATERIGRRIAEAQESTRRGIIGFSSGLGGVFGTIAGFNLGARWAKEMTESPEWAQVGVQLGAAFTGQFLGAGLGQVVSRLALVFTPLMAGAAVVAGAIYVAYKAWTDEEWFKEQFDRLTELTDTWLDFGKQWASDFLEMVKGKIRDILGIEITGDVRETLAMRNSMAQALNAVNENIARNASSMSDEDRGVAFRSRARLSAAVEGYDRRIAEKTTGYNALQRLSLRHNTIAVSDLWSTAAAAQETRFKVKEAIVENAVVQGIKRGFDALINPKRTPGETWPHLRKRKAGAMDEQVSFGKRLMNLGEKLLDVVVPSAHAADPIAAFKAEHIGAASKVGERLGIDPDILLAQAGLETNWGRSIIPGTNNIGNVKDFSGGGVEARDNMLGTMDRYKVFDSIEEAWDYQAGLFERKYKAALGVGGDVNAFAAAMRSGGYAEDPAYAEKLVRVTDSVRQRSAEPTLPTVYATAASTGVGDFIEAARELGGKLIDAASDLPIVKSVKDKIFPKEQFGPPEELLRSNVTLSDKLKFFSDAEETIHAINGALESIGVAVRISSMEQVDQSLLEGIVENFDNIARLQVRASEAGYWGAEKAKRLIKEHEKKIKEQSKNLILPEDAVGERDRSTALALGAKAFDKLQNDMISGVAAAMSGKMNGSDILKHILDSFTTSVIDMFVTGLISSLSDALKLENTFKEMFANVFELGEKPGLGVALAANGKSDKEGGKEGGTATAVEGVAGKGLFEKLKEGLSGAFTFLKDGLFDAVAGVPDLLSKAFGSIMKLFQGGGGGGGGGGFFTSILSIFGFNQGGPVVGAGTGTSDSIPAYLSHGEFVVRASQALKHRSLLMAINNGSLPRFADGGFVSRPATSGETSPLTLAASGAASTQTIQINVTGDISRQTKAEIFRMLPSIAEGVNVHNREKGYRG